MRRRSGDEGPPAALSNPRIRNAVYQILLIAAVVWIVVWIVLNARANLGTRVSGFDFLWRSSGFGINQTLIPYDESSTYARVFLVGLLNTLLVAGLGIVLATVLGFAVGIGRLSSNWLVARIAGGYVELIRNLPLLFQILFWYLAVLSVLPLPRQGISIFSVMFLSVRGLEVPTVQPSEGMLYVAAAFAFGVLATVAEGIRLQRLREATGRQVSLTWRALVLMGGLPLVVFVATGAPLTLEVPHL